MIDSEPLWLAVEQDFVAARGGAWTAEHAHRCIGRGFANMLQVMSDTFGFAIDVAADTRTITEAFLSRVSELRLKPGLLELLDAAQGAVPIAVASSSSARVVRGVLDRFGLAARFDAVVSSDMVAAPKPAPDVFLRAARDIDVSPSACVVLEDSLAGATAGRAAGMFVIAVPEVASDAFAAVADRVVTDLFAARAMVELPALSAKVR